MTISMMTNVGDPQIVEADDLEETVMLMRRRTGGIIADEYMLGHKHVVQIMYQTREGLDSVYVIES